jgi:hypothetical protein
LLNLVFEDAWQAPNGFKGLVALAGGVCSSLMVASEVGVEGKASSHNSEWPSVYLGQPGSWPFYIMGESVTGLLVLYLIDYSIRH